MHTIASLRDSGDWEKWVKGCQDGSVDGSVVSKCDDLRSVQGGGEGAPWKERTDSCRLSPGIHSHAMACAAYIHTHTHSYRGVYAHIQVRVCTHTHTFTYMCIYFECLKTVKRLAIIAVNSFLLEVCVWLLLPALVRPASRGFFSPRV